MVCLRNMCVDTLHKGDNDDDDNNKKEILAHPTGTSSSAKPTKWTNHPTKIQLWLHDEWSEDCFTAFPPKPLLSAIIPFHCTAPQSTSPILFCSAFRTNRTASMWFTFLGENQRASLPIKSKNTWATGTTNVRYSATVLLYFLKCYIFVLQAARVQNAGANCWILSMNGSVRALKWCKNGSNTVQYPV